MSKSLIIEKLTRYSSDGEFEEIEFKPGVNLIVGEPRAGKTIWLQMLDYLLGDTGTVEDAFGTESNDGVLLTEKYIGIVGKFRINGELIVLERKWNEYGAKTKILVDNEEVLSDNFSKLLFQKLSIPTVKYPKGNPYSGQTWPTLSFRNLLRHIYRQENKWGDLVDRQPPSDQFATLSLILGFAEKIFPKKYEEYASLITRRMNYEAQKDQFKNMLDSFVKKMSNPIDGVTVATEEIIRNTTIELSRRIDVIEKEKKQIIRDGYNSIRNEIDIDVELFRNLIEKKVASQEKFETLIKEIKKIQNRSKKIEELILKIEDELEKLIRAKDAGSSLSDLKITHCPACDQKISHEIIDEQHCFLCHQEVNQEQAGFSDRFEFEISQLESEVKELSEVKEKLDLNEAEQSRKATAINEFLTDVNRRINPLKSKITSLINSKISDLDNEKGRIEEKIKTYERLLPNLEDKKIIESTIDSLSKEIKKLQSEIDILGADVEFERKSSVLEEGMNEYLNELNKGEKKIWNHSGVRFFINEDTFKFSIGKMKWTSLSNTEKGYFYFAYHYGLMKLSDYDEFNYPGLLIIDFPMEFFGMSTFEGYENYLIEPFVNLSKKINTPVQMIFAGRSLMLEDANTITIEKNWGI